MAHRVLVLGGGFGGIACATTLRATLDPADEVVMVDRRPTFVMGLRKNWAVLDAGAVPAGERPLARLAERGITVVQGTVESIEPDVRGAVIDGTPVEADALVVALGAARNPEAIPGLVAHAIDVYDFGQLGRARDAVESFTGGRLVVGIFGVPHPCPPAPYELAFLLAEALAARGLDRVVDVFTPLPMTMPAIGRAGSDTFQGHLEAAGITVHTAHVGAHVEPDRVVFGPGRDGSPAADDLPFDLLLAIPPHRVPPVAAAAGLTDGGPWVKVDARTLETRWPGVYAIGDVTAVPLSNGQQLPKAGLFAQREGETVAARIAAAFRGEVATATFAGEGACFVEMGRGRAAQIEGAFLQDPPQVRLAEPTAEQLAEKHAFESERLAAWFGGDPA